MTCNGSAETQCITCRTGRFAFEGKCLNSCPDGYYGDKKRQECMLCPNGCATCTSNGFCLTCKETWTKNKKNRCISTGSDNCDECKWICMLVFQQICAYNICSKICVVFAFCTGNASIAEQFIVLFSLLMFLGANFHSVDALMFVSFQVTLVNFHFCLICITYMELYPKKQICG